MYRDTLKGLSDAELVAMLTNLRPTDDGVARLVADLADGWSQGVRIETLRETADLQPTHVARIEAAAELARRMACRREPTDIHCPGCYASTVWIDPERFRYFFWLRRIPLSKVGPSFGRSSSWANVVLSKGHIGFKAADELAVSLDMHVDEFIAQVGADVERERLALAW